MDNSLYLQPFVDRNTRCCYRLVMVEGDTDIPNLTKRLIAAGREISEFDHEKPEFLHAMLCQVGLPRSPVDGRTFERTNGKSSLMLRAGEVACGMGEWEEFPLPYGVKPRLVMYHLCSEAVRTQTPHIDLGGSMRGFLDRIGVTYSGRNLRDFKRQMLALAACRMTLAYWDNGRIKQTTADPIKTFDAWFPKDPNQQTLWADEIVLGRDFFDTLCEHAVPLDPRAVHALQHSALALDVYTWLAHRLCRVRSKNGTKLSWRNLKEQFGHEYRTSKDFKKAFKGALLKARAVYPDARIYETNGGIVLHSSPAPIKRTSVLVQMPGSL